MGKKDTIGKISGNRGLFPHPTQKTERKMTEKGGRHSPDVSVTEREFHGKVTVPWVGGLEFDVWTRTERPIPAAKCKEKRK